MLTLVWMVQWSFLYEQSVVCTGWRQLLGGDSTERRWRCKSYQVAKRPVESRTGEVVQCSGKGARGTEVYFRKSLPGSRYGLIGFILYSNFCLGRLKIIVPLYFDQTVKDYKMFESWKCTAFKYYMISIPIKVCRILFSCHYKEFSVALISPETLFSLSNRVFPP